MTGLTKCPKCGFKFFYLGKRVTRRGQKSPFLESIQHIAIDIDEKGNKSFRGNVVPAVCNNPDCKEKFWFHFDTMRIRLRRD